MMSSAIGADTEDEVDDIYSGPNPRLIVSSINEDLLSAYDNYLGGIYGSINSLSELELCINYEHSYDENSRHLEMQKLLDQLIGDVAKPVRALLNERYNALIGLITEIGESHDARRDEFLKRNERYKALLNSKDIYIEDGTIQNTLTNYIQENPGAFTDDKLRREICHYVSQRQNMFTIDGQYPPVFEKEEIGFAAFREKYREILPHKVKTHSEMNETEMYFGVFKHWFTQSWQVRTIPLFEYRNKTFYSGHDVIFGKEISIRGPEQFTLPLTVRNADVTYQFDKYHWYLIAKPSDIDPPVEDIIRDWYMREMYFFNPENMHGLLFHGGGRRRPRRRRRRSRRNPMTKRAYKEKHRRTAQRAKRSKPWRRTVVKSPK